jgi:hypothetical protein
MDCLTPSLQFEYTSSPMPVKNTNTVFYLFMAIINLFCFYLLKRNGIDHFYDYPTFGNTVIFLVLERMQAGGSFIPREKYV